MFWMPLIKRRLYFQFSLDCFPQNFDKGEIPVGKLLVYLVDQEPGGLSPR
jgi:hypothetical protein